MAFPILTRAWRTQWRNPRVFALLLAIVGAFAGLLVWRYGALALEIGVQSDHFAERLLLVGEALWRQSAWLQTLVMLGIAPALTAGAIARERERGLLESLQLAPLVPLQIVLEKWASALAPVALVVGALLPLNLILVLSGGASLAAFGLLTGFQMLCAGAGAAIGLVCSAWARRAQGAARSAYGFLLLWLLSSGASALAAGEGPLPFTVTGAPAWVRWWGRTNPIFAANDLIAVTPFEPHWPFCVAALCAITLGCLTVAARALRRPLASAPFIGARRAGARRAKTRAGQTRAGAPSQAATPLGYFELPLIGALRFSNPVMGREVRSKFRLRQPPVAVVAAEMVLGVLVLFFYARTLGVALLQPSSRQIIFWGVTFTGLIMTLSSCGIMGANSLSREHEDGGWEGLRLSLLGPRAIVGGKVGGITLTCALFSVAVWPLLLPCVSWGAFWPLPYSGEIAPSQLVAVLVTWFGSMWGASLWGLWLGARTRKNSAASALTLGSGLLWVAGGPLVLTWLRGEAPLLSALNPFLALTWASDAAWPINYAVALGLPFGAAMLGVGAVLWALLEIGMRREIG